MWNICKILRRTGPTSRVWYTWLLEIAVHSQHLDCSSFKHLASTHSNCKLLTCKSWCCLWLSCTIAYSYVSVGICTYYIHQFNLWSVMTHYFDCSQVELTDSLLKNTTGILIITTATTVIIKSTITLHNRRIFIMKLNNYCWSLQVTR